MPEAQPAPRRVAVSGTPQTAARLATALRERGADVLELPLLEVEVLPTPPLREALAGGPGDAGGWLVLTSPAGARALGRIAGSQIAGGQLARSRTALAGWQLAAVGPGTARVLEDLGWRPAFVSLTATGGALGQTLPARPGQAVWHLTSARAEDDLQRALTARGLPYRRLETYRTCPRPLRPDEAARLRQAGVVALGSGSVARALAAGVGTGLRVVASGEQTARAARQAGFRDVRVAEAPSLDALAEAAWEAAAP